MRILIIFLAIYLGFRLLRMVIRSFMQGFNTTGKKDKPKHSKPKGGKINYDNTQIEDADFEEIK